MFDLDRQVFDLLYPLSGKWALLDGLVVFGAKWIAPIIIIWAAWSLLRKKDWGESKLSAAKNRFQYFALGVLAVVVSRGIVANTIHSFAINPRPFEALDIAPLVSHAATSSFPSGHMMVLVPITLLLFMYNRKLAKLAVLATLSVGIARIMAGVHWPIDIVGGIVLGALSFYLVRALFRRKKLI